MKITFTIPGRPQPKQRVRVVNNHAFTPAPTKKYETAVGFEYNRQTKRVWLGEGPLCAEILVFFKIPKSASAKRRKAMLNGEIRPTVRTLGDLDNVIKSVLDGLNGVAYHDDSQVVSIAAEKRYAENECVTATIQTIGG